MSDEPAFCEKTREPSQTGKMPDRSPDRTWGGSGAGTRCAICGAPVRSDELEFELEFTRDDRPGLDKYHVHIPCFRAWELERHSLERARSSSRGALPDVVGDRKIPGHVGARFRSGR